MRLFDFEAMVQMCASVRIVGVIFLAPLQKSSALVTSAHVETSGGLSKMLDTIAIPLRKEMQYVSVVFMRARSSGSWIKSSFSRKMSRLLSEMRLLHGSFQRVILPLRFFRQPGHPRVAIPW